MYPKCIRNVIDCFKNLPGIGEKTAERLAFSLIGFSKENLTSFSAAITDIRDKITTCEICGNIADSNICNICSDKERNSNIIFVVEKAKDISLFEKINIYKLIDRIDKESVHEIIMALKPSIEGETTMQYIKKILENKNVRVTRIATGIPMGTDIEYIDAMTLEFALEGRKDI